MGEKLGVKNLHAIPQVEKVKISVGMGKIARKGGSSNTMDEAVIQKIVDNLASITGQKPRTHMSKQAISNFKLRIGMPIGLSVTLRGKRAYDFINKLVNIALPRVRDFRGLNRKSFDGQGNYSLGIRDCTVFSEIKPEEVELVHGLGVTVCTTAQNDEEGRELLAALGFPFQKDTSREEAEEEARKKSEEEARQEAEEAALEAGLMKREEPKVEEPVEGEEGEAPEGAKAEEKDSGKPKEEDAKQAKEKDSKKSGK